MNYALSTRRWTMLLLGAPSFFQAGLCLGYEFENLITKERAEIVVHAHELKVMVSDVPGEDLKNIAVEEVMDIYGFDSFNLFRREGEHHNDQSVVVKKAGKCFAAWPGTSVNIPDWVDNFIVVPKSVRGCNVHLGFYRELDVDGLFTNITDEILECINSCDEEEEEGCPLILTGFSQGGAVAVIASILLDYLSPTVITFGAPPVLTEPCDLIDEDQHLRFVNTYGGVWPSKLCSDIVPELISSLGFMKHVGHAFSLGNNIKAAGEYPSIKYHGTEPGSLLLPASVCVSPHLRYGEKIDLIEQALADDNNFPLAVNGYSKDDMCTNHDACASGRCVFKNEDSVYGTCQGKLPNCAKSCQGPSDCISGFCEDSICKFDNNLRCNEAPCDSSTECFNGRCGVNFNGHRVCMQKADTCERCNDDSECYSNSCDGGKCTSVDEKNLRCTGAFCESNDQCSSRRCDLLSGINICLEKLPPGASCNADADCKSNQCKWRWCG